MTYVNRVPPVIDNRPLDEEDVANDLHKPDPSNLANNYAVTAQVLQ